MEIFFAEINGRKNVACFRGVANHIINDKWYKDRKSNVDDEAEHLVKTVAKIIKNEFNNFLQTDDSTKYYSSPGDVEKLGWVPKYLKLFLSLLIKCEFKAEAIGQCIMKSAKPVCYFSFIACTGYRIGSHVWFKMVQHSVA